MEGYEEAEVGLECAPRLGPKEENRVSNESWRSGTRPSMPVWYSRRTARAVSRFFGGMRVMVDLIEWLKSLPGAAV